MMEVHPPGSSLSSQDRGRPGESLGVGLSVEHCFFYDITNLFVAIECNRDFEKARLRTILCIVALHRGGVHLMDITGMD